MKKHSKQTDQQRRNFLRNSLATSAGAMIVSAAPAVAVASSPEEDTGKLAKKKAGYQLSQHVIDYYKSCAR